MTAADNAISTAIVKAKTAKTLREACAVLAPIAEPIGQLQLVTPPKGFEREFSEERNGLSTNLDVLQNQRCADDSGLDADAIRGGIERLHKLFAKLQQIGVK